MDIHEDDSDISHKIKSFLSKDKNFRDPNFDPSPYLIKVLKEKEANQELLVQKQKELIQLQNQCDSLIEQVATQKHQQFFNLVHIPKQYGQQLQMLKQNMANVKRKVKQTKNLLIMTQKDIQQIHLNCYFNKLVHQKLKQLQLKLNQYQSASLALKNHMYLDCAQNLPVFTGNSVLQATLAARSDNLKLKFLHQAIEEVRLFLYFTPRLRLPASQRFLQRSEQKDDIFNQQMHQGFKKRYLLFKKVKCQEYLSSIWGLQGLQQRTGKVSVIYDIIKGIIRIGKASQITESFSLDVKKSINNIFQVILFFFSKEQSLIKYPKNTPKWFTSPEVQTHQTLLSVLFCVSAALIRKMIILRRMCYQYHIVQVVEQLKTQIILEIVRDQIFELIKKIYFPENTNNLTLILNAGFQELFNTLKSVNKFAYWPYFKKIIQRSFQILVQQLTQVQKKLFEMQIPQTDTYLKPFQNIFHKKFIQIFHEQYMKEYGLIFGQGRGFNLETFDNILLQRQYKAQDIQFCKRYSSESGKSIKEFINLISYLNSLKAYFINNNFQPLRYKKYRMFFILMFYLKLNSTIYRYVVSPTQYDKIIELRNRQIKIKSKEKHIESNYEIIVCGRGDKLLKVQKKYLKYQQNDHPQLRNVEQLKMIKSLTQMFFYYCTVQFSYLQNINHQSQVDNFSKEIEKNEPSNYDENLHSKLIRVWEQLIKPSESLQKNLDFILCGVLKRWLELYFVINSCLYLQTGIY